MKNIARIIPFMFLLVFVAIITPANANKGKSSIIPVQASASNGLDEAKAYRMLYDNQVKSNDAILKTIFYALGGLASAIVLVFASNWWFNEKKVADIRNGINMQISEAKNAALNEVVTQMNALTIERTAQINELQSKLNEMVSASIAELTAKNNEFHDVIRAEIKEDNKSLLSNYQAQLEAFNKSYRQEVTTLSDNIKSQIDSVSSKIKYSEDNLKNRIMGEIDFVRRDVARNEFYMWKASGVMANALAAQVEELEIMLKHPDEDRDYDFYLDQMSKTLDALSSLDADSKEEAVNLIKTVPDKFKSSKNNVLAQLGKIKTTKY